MWDKPEVLNRITKAILAFTLLFALWVSGRALLENRFPFTRVLVVGANHAETQRSARDLAPALAGGFFSMDLNDARLRFETLPWVRRADVRRAWPDQLQITLEEHEPVAAWNDRASLSTLGEVFGVKPASGLPRILAPEGMEREVARRYGEFVTAITPLGLKVEQITLSPRMSWHLGLSGDAQAIEVELGRDRVEERLLRFARFYPQAVVAVGPIQRFDMRYPNGFSALRAGPGASAPTHQEKRA